MSDDTATPFHLVDLGYCRWCGRPVRSDSFADDAESHREYMITATCSACQTRMFGGQTDPDLPDSCPILHGAIVGTVSDGAVCCRRRKTAHKWRTTRAWNHKM